MTVNAVQAQYRAELIAGFEQDHSLLRESVTHEATIKGSTAYFAVGDSGDATAVTRGQDGLIPMRTDQIDQYACVLQEWHDLAGRTDFNIFEHQGDGIGLMRRSTMAVINRKIDSDILSGLSAATTTLFSGDPQPFSFEHVTRIGAIQTANKVPNDRNRTAVITGAMHAYMLGWPEFSSADYIIGQPISDAKGAWSDQVMLIDWAGWKWIVHPQLSLNTSAEVAYFYHKRAMGHAANVAGMSTGLGWNEEQAYTYCRASMDMGTKLLQNSGIVKFYHDGSDMAAD